MPKKKRSEMSEEEVLKAREATNEYMKVRCEKLQAEGKCIHCLKPNDSEYKTCDECRAKRQDIRHSRKLQGLCVGCGEPAAPKKCQCQKCLDRISEVGQEQRHKLKIEVMQAVGECRCAVCGITNIDMLNIDHVNNDGSEHRKEVAGGHNLYAWLKKNNYPEGFQVLCYNCNNGKYLLGRQPTATELYGDHFPACNVKMRIDTGAGLFEPFPFTF